MKVGRFISVFVLLGISISYSASPEIEDKSKLDERSRKEVKAIVLVYSPSYDIPMVRSVPKKIGPITYGYEGKKFTEKGERVLIKVYDSSNPKYSDRKYTILRYGKLEEPLDLSVGDKVSFSLSSLDSENAEYEPVWFVTIAASWRILSPNNAVDSMSASAPIESP